MLEKLQTVLSKSTSDALVAALPTSSGERQNYTTLTATMSADTLQVLASAGKGESTRTTLRVIILCLIAGAAIASRLFSVIRKCPGDPELSGRGGRQVWPSLVLVSYSCEDALLIGLFTQVSRVLFTNVGDPQPRSGTPNPERMEC